MQLQHFLLVALATISAAETNNRPACTETNKSPLPTIPSALALKYPRPTPGYGWEKERGPEWGSVEVHNNCEEQLFIRSYGANKIGGPREGNTKGDVQIPCDATTFTILPGDVYVEDYRMTCHRSSASLEYCPDEDKVSNQGVSFKISRDKAAWTEIIQLEYMLVQEPDIDSPRLKYDVSLLDCGRRDGVTDAKATPEDHKQKIEKCPGYKDGLYVTFGNNGWLSNCPPILCGGQVKCDSIYGWDRTWRKEASLACGKEFKGNLQLYLCATRSSGNKGNSTQTPRPTSAVVSRASVTDVDVITKTVTGPNGNPIVQIIHVQETTLSHSHSTPRPITSYVFSTLAPSSAKP